MATYAAGRVTFLNVVAQSLTGWTQDQSIGLPLEQIFVVSNEETGAPIENLFKQVLQEGQIVGLANSTRLTFKDRQHTSIEDSAAPIRDAKGNIIGIVLAFRDITKRREAERDEKKAGEER